MCYFLNFCTVNETQLFKKNYYTVISDVQFCDASVKFKSKCWVTSFFLYGYSHYFYTVHDLYCVITHKSIQN